MQVLITIAYQSFKINRVGDFVEANGKQNADHVELNESDQSKRRDDVE